MADTQSQPQTNRRPGPTRLTVLRTERLTPHMVRVVLGGDGFDDIRDNGFTDAYLKLVFPRPGVELPEPLDLRATRANLPPEQRPVVRTYTMRSFDPVARELAVDFVLHGDDGHDGHAGVAAPWAEAAQPGDTLLVAGPGGAYTPRHDVDWHLLVGDDAALPAIASALEAMPPDVTAVVVVEVDGPADELPLVSPATMELTWLHRSTPGYSAENGLLDAVRKLDFRPGTVQAFVHGELAAIRRLRPHLREERQVPADLLSLSGYWRRGKDEDGFQAEKRTDPR